jgi:hypothetical protein
VKASRPSTTLFHLLSDKDDSCKQTALTTLAEKEKDREEKKKHRSEKRKEKKKKKTKGTQERIKK